MSPEIRLVNQVRWRLGIVDRDYGDSLGNYGDGL
jgi:hypothetical protein